MWYGMSEVDRLLTQAGRGQAPEPSASGSSSNPTSASPTPSDDSSDVAAHSEISTPTVDDVGGYSSAPTTSTLPTSPPNEGTVNGAAIHSWVRDSVSQGITEDPFNVQKETSIPSTPSAQANDRADIPGKAKKPPLSMRDKIFGAVGLLGGAGLLYSWASNGFDLDIQNLLGLYGAWEGLKQGLATFGLGASLLPWATAVILILGALLGGKKKDRAPNAYEEGAGDFVEEVETHSVWTSGPVLAIASGLALAALGINMSSNAPAVQQIAVPQATLRTALATATGYDASQVSNYGNMYYQTGDGTAANPDKLVFVRPGPPGADGGARDVVNVYNLKPGLRFVSDQAPPNSYIPFFNADGSPNPAAVQAVLSQSVFLNQIQNNPNLSVQSQQALSAYAAAANKAVEAR